MANLIKLDTNEYPVSTTEFLNRHQQYSFPQQTPYEEFGYAVVFPAPPPTYDLMTQYAREIAPVLTVKGHWEQQYDILDLDAETIAANKARQVEQNNARLLAEILDLQALALRALVEDTDTVWLDKRRAAIAALRDQIVK